METAMATPEITYTLTAEQDDIPVRGNAMCSGDDAVDKEVEDEILARLDRGDVWAWASVKVVAECEGFEGCDYLGGCCYKDAKDFATEDGYYPQMKDAALEDLKATLATIAARGSKASKLLNRLST
jgi:hypothetical protein